MSDGISALLKLPSVGDRKLALKQRGVQPFHLRMALEDEDPSVRLAAAKHPALTKEIMQEILLGDDRDLKQAIKSRSDLHPDLVEDPEETNLIKNIGALTYPLLGEHTVHTSPMHISTAQKPKREALVGAQTGPSTGGLTSFTANRNSPSAPSENTLSAYAIAREPKAATPVTSQKFNQGSPVKTYQIASKIDANKATEADSNHEAQHVVFARLAQKYGNTARARIVATTLSKLKPELRDHLKSLYHATGTTLNDPMEDPEEMLAYTHNYLTSPLWREKIHARMGLADVQAQRDSMDKAKVAWKQLRRIGANLKPDEVGVQLKSNKISDWVKTLQKTESNAVEQLGFNVTFQRLISVAEFLTGRKESMDTMRRALRATDGDPKEAVLLAYNLTSESNRRAFDAIKDLEVHKAQELLRKPKFIQDIYDGKVASEITQAYKHGRVQAVTLGGKHSGGSYIASDSEGHNWLLKPGSGKLSPAAGVKDQPEISESRREAAFSDLARLFGIPEVPEARLLIVDGKEVAGIKMCPLDWLNLHKTMDERNMPNLATTALEHYRRNGELFKWACLDYVGGNGDRHGNNILVGSAEEGHPIGLIDHGSAWAGDGFDPAHDQDSFIPYYLRAWGDGNFHLSSKEDQMKRMPKVSGIINEQLHEWIKSIHPADVEKVAVKYGINPHPALKRLEKIQALSKEHFSTELCKLWLGEPKQGSKDIDLSHALKPVKQPEVKAGQHHQILTGPDGGHYWVDPLTGHKHYVHDPGVLATPAPQDEAK